MLTAKKVQKLIKKAADNIKNHVRVVSIRGQIIASNNERNIGKICSDILNDDFDRDNELVLYNDNVYKKVFPGKSKSIYVVVQGRAEVDINYAYLISYLIESEWRNTIKKLDRDQIFRRIILQQIKPIEIYGYLKDFDIEESMKRCILLINIVGEYKNKTGITQILNKAFQKSSSDIIVQLNEETVVLIKAFKEDFNDNEDIIEMAQAIQDTIMNETYMDTKIGVGTIKQDINQLYKSFEEAKIALDIGNIFVVDKSIFIYELMALERLLFGATLEQCIDFYNEVFGMDKDKLMNEEMYMTIEKFFQNNLNLSETSRQLYIHRNTLVYRLDKMQRMTGLDLRNFDDAVTFKIIMMIGRYIKYKHKKH